MLAVAVLALASCEPTEDETDAVASHDTRESGTYAAKLSCRVNGSPIAVATCFTGQIEAANGSLKITNGGRVHQYTMPEIYAEMNRPGVSIDLEPPFEIDAQSSGEDSLVLGVQISLDNNRVFEDEAAAFSSIYVSDEIIEYNNL